MASKRKEESSVTPVFLWSESIVLCTAFWKVRGRGKYGRENQKLSSLKCEIRNSIEDVELAVEYISLVSWAETGLGLI